jgi:hypothetical protein
MENIAGLMSGATLLKTIADLVEDIGSKMVLKHVLPNGVTVQIM